MGAIAAAMSESLEESEALVTTMLRALSHRGSDTKTFEVEAVPCCIGYGSYHNLEPNIFESDSFVAVVDGSIFRTSQPARFVHRQMSRNQRMQATRAVLEEPGAFACVLARGKSFHVFRDLNGTKPLYYSKDSRRTVFASERKALWRIGLTKATRVIPGHLYSINRRRLTKTLVARFARPREAKMTLPQAASKLSHLVSESMQHVAKGVDRLAVAFSGGLDSAVVATLATKTKSQVEAVSAGLSGSSEMLTVEKWAKELGIPITVETLEPAVLENYVRRVVWLIEEPNLMKVSVAVPLHWAASIAARRGFNVMLCGQGSDELYGGYAKYARTLDSKGRKALVKELYESVVNSSEVNYERDDQATSPFGVELRTPFADLDVIKFSMTIPSEFKVKEGNDLTRKWVLRSVAKNTGLPEGIVWRRKKAIQHGTGVENAIRKLAKERGLSVDAYLLKVFEEVRIMESMP